MFRASRDRRANGSLGPRIALFVIGAAFGLAGIAFDRGWLVSAGIVVLAAGVIAGLRGARSPGNGSSED